jgi:hypothetical protein
MNTAFKVLRSAMLAIKLIYMYVAENSWGISERIFKIASWMIALVILSAPSERNPLPAAIISTSHMKIFFYILWCVLVLAMFSTIGAARNNIYKTFWGARPKNSISPEVFAGWILTAAILFGPVVFLMSIGVLLIFIAGETVATFGGGVPVLALRTFGLM